jgi:hypothetical protein
MKRLSCVALLAQRNRRRSDLSRDRFVCGLFFVRTDRHLLRWRTDEGGGSAKQAQITYVTTPSSGQTQGMLRVGIRHKF